MSAGYGVYVAQTTLVRHESDGGEREIVLGRPAPQLHAQVSGYCGYFGRARRDIEWQRGVQVDLTPLGAHMLLGVPMDTLANRVVELDEVLGSLAARLAEQLYETGELGAALRLARRRSRTPTRPRASPTGYTFGRAQPS